MEIKNLVCRMITISENATQKGTLSAQKWFFVMIGISKNVKILFSVKFFLNVIWSTNMISVSVIVLQMRNTMLVIIELIFHLPFTTAGT